MKSLFFAFFLLLSTIACAQKATGNEKQYLTTKDSVFLTMSSEKGKVFEHRIAEKQTLYSISKFYGIPLSELYTLNPALKKNEGVAIGQAVKVTIPNRAIKRYKKKGFKAKEHCKVFYVAKKGDNIQKIAKNYFDMPIDTIKNRNSIKGNEVREGQKILIGWMNVHGVPEEKEVEVAENNLIRKDIHSEVTVPDNYEVVRKIYMTERKTKKEVLTQGLAAWDKREKLVPALFNALYRDAPIGTIIAVSNPTTDKVVFLKVVGTIPTGKYDKKTVVIITPAAAQSLGATTESFATKVRFLK